MATKTVDESRYIVAVPAPKFSSDPRGMGAFMYDCMLKNKDKLAQIYGPTGEKDTHGELLQRAVRLAIAMKKSGVKRGDFVSNCTFNHLDSGTPIIASLFIGAIMAAVDPTLSLEETVILLQQTPPKIIFVTPEAVEMIEKVIETIKSDTKIIVYGFSEKYTLFSDCLQPSEEENNFQPVVVQSIKDTAIIFFTSGTSGLPKGICLSHYAILSGYSLDLGLDLSLVFAYSSPYWTIFFAYLCQSIITGTVRLVYPRFDSNNVWHPFSYKITCAFFNITQILAMLSKGRPKDLDISSIKDILLGGSCMMLSKMSEAKATFPETRVHMSYGQTEVVGAILFFQPNIEKNLKFIKEKPSAAGYPLPGISYKIVDPETERTLGPNQQGELRIKTELALNGYHNRDSSEIWDSDGFLKTGDVGYYDEDKCFYVVDRIKEMFKFEGWHVVPMMIESVLLKHPAVEIAVVIGVPHEIDGDHPMGLVKLKSFHQATPDEIVKFVEQRVHDRQRLRAGVKFVDDFATTASGKISRRKLREMILNENI